MRALNPFPIYLLSKIKLHNPEHSNLNKFSNFKKCIKIYFQLRIPKYPILGHIFN